MTLGKSSLAKASPTQWSRWRCATGRVASSVRFQGRMALSPAITSNNLFEGGYFRRASRIGLSDSQQRGLHNVRQVTMERFKLVYTVPATHVQATKNAIFTTGAGVYEGGKYVQVAFELIGQGQFLPVAEAGADPHTGSVGQLERVLEYRIEVLCDGRDVAKAAVAALKQSHPYEVPAYEVYKLENF